MSDSDQTTPEDLSPEEDRGGRSYETLGTILLIVTVVVVVLLLWRSCSIQDQGGVELGGEPTIQSVEGLEPVEGAVSVWVKDDVEIETVLERNGLADAETTDLGEGTWVIAIGDVDAAATIERLKEDPGLNDAGFLYRDEMQE